MPAYVDPLFSTLPSARWPYHQACHLFADTIQELDDLAIKLGLKPGWQQDRNPNFVHFDLTPNKRALAIKLGAQQVVRQYVVDFVQQQRER